MKLTIYLQENAFNWFTKLMKHQADVNATMVETKKILIIKDVFNSKAPLDNRSFEEI